MRKIREVLRLKYELKLDNRQIGASCKISHVTVGKYLARFVAALGASNYTYAEATMSQQLEDWIGSHVRSFEFFGGVTQLIVPDNLKSGVTRPCRYEPDLNQTYQEMAAHYGTAVLPARSRKPRDKAKVESAVLIAERWIIAVLRHRKFFSLAELNAAIRVLLVKFNTRRFNVRPRPTPMAIS